MRWQLLLVGIGGLAGALASVSCGAGTAERVSAAGGGVTDATTSAAAAGTSTSSSRGGAGGGGVSGGGGSGLGAPCHPGLNEDADRDGWTIAQGDCNDCDPSINPGAVDFEPKPSLDGGAVVHVDSNCDGKFEPPVPCDAALALASDDPADGARAVELCAELVDPRAWGVKSARWAMPDGAPAVANANYALGHGMLAAFGPNVHPQAGKRMLGLSSGSARQPGDPGYHDVKGFDKGFTSNSPYGYPKPSPSCGVAVAGEPHDGVALELEVVAPTNAHGFSFDLDFFTYEWPAYVCSEYEDFFVALLMPFPAGQKDGSLVFDVLRDPMTVNNGFLDVCGCGGPPPCHAGGKSFACPLGDARLDGTGFGAGEAGEDHGSTYWLRTTAPVAPHESFTVRWAVYDSGDGVLDSTTLVDHWRWLQDPGTPVATTRIAAPR